MPKRRAAVDSRKRIASLSRSIDHAIEPLESRMLMARVDGIDISHWQGAKSLAQMQQAYNAGKRFMFHKATEGTDYVDPEAAGNIANAKAAGLLVGVYHFPHPQTNAAVTEANWFISTAQANGWVSANNLRPVLDLEDGASLSQSALSTWTTTWCQTVKNALGIDPIIYSNGSYAQSEVNSTVNVYPFWYANPTTAFGDPHTTATPTPTSLLGVWQTKGWNFWQYSWTESVPGFSSGIDADVYNGDYLSLQQNFLIGSAPGKPATPSPASGATNVNRNGLILNCDSANATSYDVYLDGSFQTNVAVSQWTPPTLGQGSHNWQVYAKNTAGTVAGDLWTFSIASLGTPAMPSNPFPTNNGIVTSVPITLDWADSANATSYQVWSGASLVGTSATSQYGTISPIEGVRTWKVVAINQDASTTGPTWTFTVDKTAPTAAYGNQTPTTGATTFNFTVNYADVTTGVDTSTFDNNDVTVTGPNNFSANASYISRVGNVATYQIVAPGGVWNPADAGLYSVSINAGQVKDIAGWAVPTGSAGTFTAALNYAYVTSNTLHIEYPAASSVTISAGPNQQTSTDENGSIFDFANASFNNVVIHGTSGDDAATLAVSLGKPITFDGGAGLDSLTLGAGVNYSFASNIGALSAGLRVSVANGASGVFLSRSTLRALDIDAGGSATLGAGGANTLVTQSLTVNGRLDVNDNDIVINYTGDSPLGVFDNGAYDGIYGKLSDGSNGNAWNGATGIMSTAAQATGGVTAVVAAESSDITGLSGTDTDTWNGETVDGTTVLIKYSFNGDADLNGELNGDDYFAIDSHALQSGFAFGFHNGDFDLNGEINGDDYFLIDSVILQASGQTL